MKVGSICPSLHPIALVALLACLAPSASSANEDRIWIKASINGKPTRLYFDTGACGLKLLSKGASRLGLSFAPPPDFSPNPFGIPLTKTEECDFEFGFGRIRTAFFVAKLPDAVSLAEDGSVGWQSELFAGKIVNIAASSATVAILPKLPAEALQWKKWRMRTNDCIVGLDLPGAGLKASFVNIDTGSPGGIMLCPKRWREWQASHPNRAKTLNAYSTQGSGLVVAEEAWAQEIVLGPLTLRDVPVMEANHADVTLSGNGFEATLGLAALRRLDLILDAKEHAAYLRRNQARPVPYEHNCLGAVFTPEDLLTYKGENLVAHVAPGSPGFLAGIRDGDMLLKYNDIDVTTWRAYPTVIPSFVGTTNETPVQLTLKRGTKTFTLDLILKPILVPGAAMERNGTHG